MLLGSCCSARLEPHNGETQDTRGSFGEVRERRKSSIKARGEYKRSAVIDACNDPEQLDVLFDKVLGFKRKAEEGEEAAPAAKRARVDDLEWNAQYGKPKDTPTKLLKPVLQAMNDVVFSDGNLHAGYWKPGMKDVPKETCSELLEYAADIPKGLNIAPEERNLEFMTKRALRDQVPERFGRLLLPADFTLGGPHGIYTVFDNRDQGKGISAAFKHGKNTEPRRVTMLLEGELELDANYSKVDATIRENMATVSSRSSGFSRVRA